MGGDVFAGQVDDGVDVVELGGVDLARVRIPTDFTIAVANLVPHDTAHEVAVGFERFDERLPTRPVEPVTAMIMSSS